MVYSPHEYIMNNIVDSEYVVVGGVNTHILKCGQPTSDGHLALIIPGNPGIIEFYEEFMCTLYKSSDGQLPVWGISHAGHVKAPVVNVAKSGGPSMYDLKGQILHKLLFIKEQVPASTKLILIGHSIGCYMILEMLKQLDDVNRVTKCYLLFPTIERMAISPQGQIMTPLLKYGRHVAAILVYLLSWLPEFLRKMLIGLHLSDRHIPKCARSAALNLFDAPTTYNCMYLANIEMASVRELDPEPIKRFKKKLTFYFGSSDHWCPVEYYHSMMKEVPQADARLCTRGMNHAFILGSGVEMAEMVWNWVQPLVDHLHIQNGFVQS